MVNPNFEPTDEEEAVLDVLEEEKRANPYLIREETGLGKGSVNTALTRLTSAGWVLKVTRGLYEFVDDPRGDGSATRDAPRDDRPASPPADPPTATDTASDDESGVTEVHRQHLREELTGSGDTLEARVDAIIAMYGYLRKVGEAEKSDFLDLVDPEVVRYDSPDSVWSNMVKGKDTLASLPGVEKPDTGLTTWRYRR